MHHLSLLCFLEFISHCWQTSVYRLHTEYRLQLIVSDATI